MDYLINNLLFIKSSIDYLNHADIIYKQSTDYLINNL